MIVRCRIILLAIASICGLLVGDAVWEAYIAGFLSEMLSPRTVTAQDSHGLVYFVYHPDEPAIIAPSEWASWAYLVGMCESRWTTKAIGKLGERGVLQVHPIHDQTMYNMGLDPYTERDRLTFAIHLWGYSGETWRQHWYWCSRKVGAP